MKIKGDKKMKSTKKSILVMLVAAAIALLMVSTATAVQQVHSGTVMKTLDKLQLPPIIVGAEQSETVHIWLDGSAPPSIEGLIDLLLQCSLDDFLSYFTSDDFMDFMKSNEVLDSLASDQFLAFFNTDEVQNYINSDKFMDFFDSPECQTFLDSFFDGEDPPLLIITFLVAFAGLLYGLLTWVNALLLTAILILPYSLIYYIFCRIEGEEGILSSCWYTLLNMVILIGIALFWPITMMVWALYYFG